MNELSKVEQDSILGLLRAGWSIRRIARETGRRHETIRRYGQAAGLLKPKPHTEPQVPTESAPESPPAMTSRSSCEPHRIFIEAECAKARNGVAIYQDLVEHHGYTDSYDAVKRFIRKLNKRTPKVFCRFETLAGQEAQVDYGEGALTRDQRTGKYRRPRLFIMTLSASRHAFRTVVEKSSTQTWCELHEEAFAFFGGTPETIRLDNLKEGVLKPDIYDPELNPVYAKMLAYYNVHPLPCRPYSPNLKGKVESSVGHTQSTALKGKRFDSIDEQNKFLSHWNERWASTRIHGTTKRQVRVMFEEEKPHLHPLPPRRFEYYRVFERMVHPDGHIQVDGAYYSAPPRYVGAHVIVHASKIWLRIIDKKTHQCVCEHALLKKGERRTFAADRPKQTPPEIATLVARVEKLGSACGDFAREIERERGKYADRSLFGLLELTRRYSIDSVERGCTLAVSSGSIKLRFLRTYLKFHGREISLTQTHDVIADIGTYEKHFSAQTQGDI